MRTDGYTSDRTRRVSCGPLNLLFAKVLYRANGREGSGKDRRDSTSTEKTTLPAPREIDASLATFLLSFLPPALCVRICMQSTCFEISRVRANFSSSRAVQKQRRVFKYSDVTGAGV